MPYANDYDKGATVEKAIQEFIAGKCEISAVAKAIALMVEKSGHHNGLGILRSTKDKCWEGFPGHYALWYFDWSLAERYPQADIAELGPEVKKRLEINPYTHEHVFVD